MLLGSSSPSNRSNSTFWSLHNIYCTDLPYKWSDPMDFQELFPEPPLSEIITIPAILNKIDLSKWDLSSYYEAMGLDLMEDEANENDHR